MTGGPPSSRPLSPGLTGFRGPTFVKLLGMDVVPRLGVIEQARRSDDVGRTQPGDDAIGHAKGVGYDSESRIHGANGRKETCVRHVQVVELMGFAISIEDGTRRIIAEPKRPRLV